MEKKRIVEVAMTLLLLAGAFALPRQGAKMTEEAIAQDDETVILIDVGHGGADSGKVGVNGELEKDINLEVAKYLKQNLEANGMKAVLTRESDQGLYKETDSNKKLADMKARIQMMKDEKADLAVSIHQNSYSKPSVKGAQVFYYTGSEEGERLAQAIQDGFDYALGDANNRSIKANKDYYILVHSPIPTVICECGFLSNPEEAKKLSTAEYQQEVAKSIEIGVLEYLNAGDRTNN